MYYTNVQNKFGELFSVMSDFLLIIVINFTNY